MLSTDHGGAGARAGGTAVTAGTDQGSRRSVMGRTGLREVVDQSHRRQPPISYPQIVFLFHLWTTLVDNSVESCGQNSCPRRFRVWEDRHFHCVETPNPAAMKPKPTTMFQLSSASIGRVPS